MPDYSKGKIYTIRCRTDDNKIYVGSTIQSLAVRLGAHKRNSKKEEYMNKLYQEVNNDWSNWYIELYENFPCSCREELHKKEGEIIRLIGNLNSIIAGRNKKEYYIENADKIKEYYIENKEKIKKYRIENADKIKEQRKEYRIENADKIKEKNKEYNIKNADKIKEKKKEYNIENADKIKEKKKEYYIENADKIKEYYIENADKIKEYRKEYYLKNKK
jgi:hypothetical protein